MVGRASSVVSPFYSILLNRNPLLHVYEARKKKKMLNSKAVHGEHIF